MKKIPAATLALAAGFMTVGASAGNGGNLWSGEITVDKPVVFDGRSLTIEKGASVRFTGEGGIEVKNGDFKADGAVFSADSVLTNRWRISHSGGRAEITGCRFSGLKAVRTARGWHKGFALLSSSSVKLENSEFSRCSPIMLSTSAGRVVGNRFSDCEGALALMNVSRSFAGTNVFERIRGAGIDLASSWESLENVIDGNRFTDCGTGVRVYNAHRHRITANRYSGKGVAHAVSWAVGNVFAGNAYGEDTVPYTWSKSIPCALNVYDREQAADVNGTTDDPRWVKVPALRNVRDIGSWHGMAAGRAFRGGFLFRSADGTVDGETAAAVAALGLKTDLDLRGESERKSQHEAYEDMGVLGLKTVYAPIVAYAAAVTGKRAEFAKALRVFVDAENYPVYFHCKAGADRTATLALVLEGLCGVPEEDLLEDYELTSVGFAPRNRRQIMPVLEKIKSYPGDSLADRFAAASRDLWGLSDGDIAAIRRNLMSAPKD